MRFGGGERAGEYIVLGVRDTGTGMSEAAQQRAFEPFFTTKEGRGTGLGLSICQDIAARAGGHIMVGPAVPTGTEVRVFLPRSKVAWATRPDEETAEATVVPARVLLVEDNHRVRVATARLLEAAGYDVVQAEDALSAEQKIADGLRPDLLLSDVVMPGLSGPELVDRLARRFPEMAVLFISGWSADDALEPANTNLTYPLLPKPYTVEALGNAVASTLLAHSERNG